MSGFGEVRGPRPIFPRPGQRWETTSKLRGKPGGQPRLRRDVQRLKFIRVKQASGRAQDKLDLAKLLKRKHSGYR
jgi:hypothetical protein